jgi:hypothetical protein
VTSEWVTLAALIVGPILAALIFTAPLHWLIGLNFLLLVQQDTWSLGGVLFDASDVGFAILGVAIFVRGLPPGSSLKMTRPRLLAWFALAALLGASYSVSPDGAPHMTGFGRIAYQLYRYGVKPVLLYPIACALVNAPWKLDQMFTCMIVAADVFAVMTLPQGYSGRYGTGPFQTKNELAAALIIPVVLVFIDLLSRRRMTLSLLSVPLLVRGVLFASSRGAFAGIAVGMAAAVLLLERGRVRVRLGTLAAAIVVTSTLALLVKPDLFERPTIVRVMTTVDPGQDTLVWRFTERWPYFTHRAWQKPWLGWGTDVDEDLGKSANTPHNGFLALAVSYGFPVLGLYLLFPFLAFRDAWRASARGPDREDRIRAAKIGAAVACILTHNIVDTVVVARFVGSALWIFVAGAAMLAARARRPPARHAAGVLRRPEFAFGTGA